MINLLIIHLNGYVVSKSILFRMVFLMKTKAQDRFLISILYTAFSQKPVPKMVR